MTPLFDRIARYADLPQKKKILLNPRWWSTVFRPEKLSAEVTQYLQPSNPRLLELQQRYAEGSPFDNSFWKAKSIDLLQFRGEWNYLSQLDYLETERKYLMTAAYVAAMDVDGFLERLSEDSLFGAITLQPLPDLTISRDLLDSVLEISFLRRHLQLNPAQPFVCLDIGAGYGRFAHRLTTLFPESRAYCVDGVAVSTFLCEFYARFRGFSDKATVVPLHEVNRLSGTRFDLVTNIHSWSECPLSAIRYWLGVIADLRIPFLFLIPNWLAKDEMFLTVEADGSRLSFLPEIERHGYRLKVMAPKFGNSALMAKFGTFNAPYILFER